MRVTCPHCGTVATIRSSRKITETTSEASVQCNDIECAHTWVINISACRTIAPSMKPKRGVFIPFSPRSPAAATHDSSQLDLLGYPPPRTATG